MRPSSSRTIWVSIRPVSTGTPISASFWATEWLQTGFASASRAVRAMSLAPLSRIPAHTPYSADSGPPSHRSDTRITIVRCGLTMRLSQ